MAIIRNYLKFLKSFKSEKFKKLWPAQDKVLEKYVNSKFTEKSDVAIELPTGGGKTLIALLIAEAWRRENKKIAILIANNQPVPLYMTANKIFPCFSKSRL